MRYSGSAIANTTYHIFACFKALGASPDYYADPSAVEATVLGHLQAETGGAAYLYLQRVGSILRESAAIVGFFQRGNEFSRVPTAYFSQTNPGTSSQLIAAPVPVGLTVKAKIAATIATTTVSASYGLFVSDLNIGAINATTALCTTNLQTLATAGVYRSAGYADVFTDVAARTRVQISTSDAGTTISLACYGWTDNLGRG